MKVLTPLVLQACFWGKLIFPGAIFDLMLAVGNMSLEQGI